MGRVAVEFRGNRERIMMHAKSPAAALLLVLALAACDAAEQLAAPTDLAPADELAAVLAEPAGEALTSAAPAPRGGNGLFDRLAAQIPGFGGLYRTAPCTVALVLTPAADDVRQAVRIVTAEVEPLVARSCPRGITVRPVAGEFTWTQLVGYRAAARPLFQIRGLSAITIDVPQNRLEITVASRAVAESVLAELPRVDIPAAAVGFQLASSNAGRTRG